MRLIFKGLNIIDKGIKGEKRIAYSAQNKSREKRKAKKIRCSNLCTGMLPKVHFSAQKKQDFNKNNVVFFFLLFWVFVVVTCI